MLTMKKNKAGYVDSYGTATDDRILKGYCVANATIEALNP